MEFLEQLLEMLTPFLLEIIVLVVSVVVVPQVKALLKQYGIKKFIENEKEIVLDTMTYVEKMYKHLDGPAKWKFAKDKATKKANKVGLKIDEEDIDDLINQFLEDFGDYFENWDQ